MSLDSTLRELAALRDENAGLRERVAELCAELEAERESMEVDCHLCFRDVDIREAEQVGGMWLFQCPECVRRMEAGYMPRVPKVRHVDCDCKEVAGGDKSE